MRLARLALRAYPAGYRRDHGGELLTTLAETGRERAPRELAGLIAGGLRRRAVDDRRAGFAGVFSAGCGLAALVLLLLEALAWGAPVARMVAVRLGLLDPGAMLEFMSLKTAAQLGVLAIAALAAAASLCRGRPIAASILALVPLTPHTWEWMPLNLIAATSDSSYRAGYAVWAAVVVTTAVLAAASWRRPARHSLAWLLSPVALGVLSIWFWLTTVTFWPLGILVVSLFLLSPLRPALGVAAAAIAVPVAALVAPFAVLQPQYAYAMPVLVGGFAVALAAGLFAPLREREERDRPL
jgi:hypothetical protein